MYTLYTFLSHGGDRANCILLSLNWRLVCMRGGREVSSTPDNFALYLLLTLVFNFDPKFKKYINLLPLARSFCLLLQAGFNKWNKKLKKNKRKIIDEQPLKVTHLLYEVAFFFTNYPCIPFEELLCYIRANFTGTDWNAFNSIFSDIKVTRI